MDETGSEEKAADSGTGSKSGQWHQALKLLSMMPEGATLNGAIAWGSVLLSMGMMMLPPIMVSLPFKLMLFVLVDGWNIIIGSLVKSFVGG